MHLFAARIAALEDGPVAMKVISIQSQVVHGYVGNSVAVFPMQAAGLEVAAVPTTLLSNHPHYPTMRGRVLDAALVEDLLLGVDERGLIEEASFLVTGYLGSCSIADVVADFVSRAKGRNRRLTYVCDPVMGDIDVGLYVPDGICDVLSKRLVPAADIVTPNQFEIGLLAGRAAATADDLLRCYETIRTIGCERLVATGCSLADGSKTELQTIVAQPGDVASIRSSNLPVRMAGTGDLLTAYTIVQLARGSPLRQAVTDAVLQMDTVLTRTQVENRTELAVIG